MQWDGPPVPMGAAEELVNAAARRHSEPGCVSPVRNSTNSNTRGEKEGPRAAIATAPGTGRLGFA